MQPSPVMPDRGKPSPSFLRGMLRWFRIVGIAILIFLLTAMIFEESLIFIPTKYPGGNWNTANLPIEDVHLTSADGTALHGWLLEQPKPRAVILAFHGNAGNVSHRLDWLMSLHRLRCTVCMIDYRGYGRSEGKPNEKNVLADAREARRWLAERANVQPSDIVLTGESLGGAVAVDLAGKEGARAFILENTFSSLPDMAAFHYAWPFRFLMHTKFDSESTIRDYRGPLLQFHGDSDQIVPLEFGKRLFDAANEPKELVIIPSGDHNDSRTATYYSKVSQFLERLEAVNGQPATNASGD